MSFTIRDLLPEDRPGWENLWAGYLDFYEAPLDPVVLEVTWSRLLDPNEPMMCLVAKDDRHARTDRLRALRIPPRHLGHQRLLLPRRPLRRTAAPANKASAAR